MDITELKYHWDRSGAKMANVFDHLDGLTKQNAALLNEVNLYKRTIDMLGDPAKGVFDDLMFRVKKNIPWFSKQDREQKIANFAGKLSVYLEEEKARLEVRMAEIDKRLDAIKPDEITEEKDK